MLVLLPQINMKKKEKGKKVIMLKITRKASSNNHENDFGKGKR